MFSIFMSSNVVYSVSCEGTLLAIKGCFLMLTLYMSCKGTFLFKAAKTPHATPGHVTTLRDIMLLKNSEIVPLFITFASPQSIRLNRSASTDPPQSIRLNRSASIDPPQSIHLNRSASTTMS